MNNFEKDFPKTYQWLNEDILSEIDATGVVAISAAVIITTIFASLSDQLTKAGRACGSFTGIDNQVCKYKYRIKAYENAINFATSNINKCSKAKNPQKCKEKIEKFINKIKGKISDTKNALDSVTNTLNDYQKRKKSEAEIKAINKKKNLVDVNINKK